MLFRKKKTANKAELDLHIFQTKVELRRLQEKYQTMLERELRLARQEKAAGAAQPGNRQRIKTVYYLLQTTDAAYQSLDDISTADELNRTTNALTAALQQVDQLAAAPAGQGGVRPGDGPGPGPVRLLLQSRGVGLRLPGAADQQLGRAGAVGRRPGRRLREPDPPGQVLPLPPQVQEMAHFRCDDLHAAASLP